MHLCLILHGYLLLCDMPKNGVNLFDERKTMLNMMTFYFLFNQGEGYSTLLMGMGVYHQLFSNMFDTTTLLFYSYKLSY